MNHVNVDRALSAARALASKATSLLQDDLQYYMEHGEAPEYRNTGAVAESIEGGFLYMLTVAETLGLNSMKEIIAATYSQAKEEGLAKADYFDDSATWSFWADPINTFADAIGAVFGTAERPSTAVTTDLLTILQGSQNAVTDKRCFLAPKSESEVHDRIEAVLRCVYADLLRKPPLNKPVVNFIPDSGIPSINTLIEYKFMDDEKQAGNIANEILADTRGYAESGWGRIVFVIYETRRFKTIHEWRHLLRSCGVPDWMDVILLHGEPAPVKPPSSPASPVASATPTKVNTGGSAA